MIERLEVVVYPRDFGPSRTEGFDYPDLGLVLEQLRLMDRYCRPLMFLCQRAEDHSSDAMEVMGGDGLYFIEATDESGFWYTPFNASGGSQMVEIWTSDQGNSVEEKYIWQFDDARAIIEYYLRCGEMLSAYNWKSTKQM